MPLDYSNPYVMKFLTENFTKTEERRMLWFLKNRDKLEKYASFSKNYKGLQISDIQKEAITACLPSLKLHHESSTINRRRKPLKDGVVRCVSKGQAGQDSETLDTTNMLVSEPIMKSIDPIVENILHEPLPSGGRCQYLDRRKRELPEDKYNFCETSTNVYGWRLKDSQLSRQPPTYGRYFNYKHDVLSRSGPQPDPYYYQVPPREPYSKCPS